MVVQHNLTAMNSNRMLGLTTKSQAKSTERLSSGYKINRAADDAAGLSISEKMRKQIRGLSQASLNAADGISAVQTAEGALNEVQDLLQRMNELAVKAANGTMSEDDRKYIQDEVNQLITEIDRVAETTKFNETYLLKGDGVTTTSTTVKEGAGATFAIATGKAFKEAYTLKDGATFYAVSADGTQVELNKDTTADDLATYIDKDGNAKEGYVIYKSEAETSSEHGSQISTDVADAATVKAQIIDGTTGLMDKNGLEVKEADLEKFFDKTTGVYQGGLYSTLSADNAGAGNSGSKGDRVEIGADVINTFVDVTVNAGTDVTTSVSTKNALRFSLQVGAETSEDNKISVDIDAMDATSLGVGGLKVDGKTSENADNAVKTIATAIQKVSTQRSALGAVQNRLEHTIANLDNVVENTTAAESQIRDTDMATEMVKYSNNNILAQAGQAMLAQANQANQGVLSLLG